MHIHEYKLYNLIILDNYIHPQTKRYLFVQNKPCGGTNILSECFTSDVFRSPPCCQWLRYMFLRVKISGIWIISLLIMANFSRTAQVILVFQHDITHLVTTLVKNPCCYYHACYLLTRLQTLASFLCMYGLVFHLLPGQLLLIMTMFTTVINGL